MTGVRMMLDSAELQGVFLQMLSRTMRTLASAVADRTGTDPDRDMYPHLVAAAVGSATQIASDRWLNSKGTAPLDSLMRDALRQIAAGLPTP
jgi:hypothetical protein